MSKPSQLDKAIAALERDIAVHRAEIAVLQAAINRLEEQRPPAVRRPKPLVEQSA